jgi:hypothetical protein
MLFIYLLFFCLHFININNVCLPFEKTLKGHQYGHKMKGLDLGNKNMLFIFLFLCLFTFRQHKSQWLRDSSKLMRRWRLHGKERLQRTLLF